MRRCGSSWLHSVLSSHPEIDKPDKGLHFFNRNFSNGIQWYEERLANCLHSGKTVGEFSTTYLYPECAEIVAQRIRNVYPDIKLIFSIRNPIDRSFSDYRRSLRTGDLPPCTFEEAVQEEPGLIQRSIYYPLLYSFYSRFEKCQIFPIVYDDICNRPKEVIASLYKYIGVDTSYCPIVVDKKLGSTYSMRSPRVERLLSSLQSGTKKILLQRGLNRTAQWLRSLRVDYAVRYLNTYDDAEKKSFRNSSLIKKNKQIFREDICRVADLSGLSLCDWVKDMESIEYE